MYNYGIAIKWRCHVAKIKVTITLDEKVFEGFKKAIPEYISISGFLDSVIREYMAGYYKFDWSVGDMFDVLKGKVTVSRLQKIHELGLDGEPGYIIDTALAQDEEKERLEQLYGNQEIRKETAKKKEVVTKVAKTSTLKKKKGA